jgi:excisionase family DNA binding protein
MPKRVSQPAQSEKSTPVTAARAPVISPMLTANELANYLRVNRSTVYRLLKRGELPGFRIGSEWRFQIEEVNRWLKSRGATLE